MQIHKDEVPAMGSPMEAQNEYVSRLDLIETMLREGRRTTEYWGWCFVLWGAAYIIAIGWSFAPATAQFSWPVTMIVAGIVTWIFASKKTRAMQSRSPLSRAIAGVWASMGISLFIFGFATGYSGHFTPHAGYAAIMIMIGSANCASGVALRWRMQFLVALLWWISGVVVCFVPAHWLVVILLIDAFLGFVWFGIYLMARERSDRRRSAQHA